ncbi:MAG TPA: hypothetical protein VFK05_39350 [Polyangiaceae bacterium]|nr:hypothetical protein [Polyangiaceae bacterium]
MKAPRPPEPVYRFVSLGVSNPAQQQLLDGGRIGVLTDGGFGREIVNADGSVEPSQSEGGSLLGMVAVPARLGGGFLFWQDALYWASSFNGPLQPVVDLPTNAIGIEFGPDYLLLLLSKEPPRALALNPPRSVPLSPKGVIDVVALDDGRALALDATGRALASRDAGKSWSDVSSLLGARVSGVAEGERGIAFVLPGDDAWLQPDGQFARLASPPRERRVQQTPADFLRQAIGNGLPLPEGRAWIGDGRGTRVVDLHTGAVSPVKAAGPEGSSCIPISVEEEGVLLCFDYSANPTTTVVSHALGATPVMERTFRGSPQRVEGRELSIIASCSGARAEGSACVRHAGGAWTEVKVAPDVLRAWRPAFWVPRESGGVALIVSQREVFRGEPKIALLDPLSNRITPWDSTLAQVTPNDAEFRSGASLTLLDDGSLRGFTAKRSIAVDPRGHVTLGEQTFASISSAGTHALARDNAERLWQTSDSGAHWLEVASPAAEDAPEGTGAKLNPRPSGRATRIDCSRSGCALEHSSGTGFWLRLGWPEARATAQTRSGAPEPRVARAWEPPAGSMPSLPEAILPQLNCTARGPGPLPAKTPPRTPPAPKGREQWQEVLAGQRALAARGTHRFANIDYRDVFAAEPFQGGGLRAALHLNTADVALRDAVGKKTPLDVRFVEPFDTQGRVRKLSTSIEDWSPLGVSTRPADPLHDRRMREAMDIGFGSYARDEGAARPLLSSELGRAGGVLLIDAPSLAADTRGKIQPIRSGCSPVSGYLDARGKGFVACAERNGSTHIEALDMPQRELVRAPAAVHFRSRERAGLHFYAPGESPFVNPDAIAVGRDGKLSILRLPPGDEPPTEDNPAWLLSADAAPVALAPWSKLELATKPECAGGDGVRAIVQTETAWFDVVGTRPSENRSMTALVRWGTQRVCLEAVEVGFDSLAVPESRSLRITAVARFAGPQPGAALIGFESNAVVRAAAVCEVKIAPP